MTLLDTNVVIDAQNHKSPFYAWAGGIILGAIAATGAAINAVTLAELCAAERAQAEKVEAEIASAGVHIIDLPVAAAPICGRAYIRYRSARRRSRGGDAPVMPLPRLLYWRACGVDGLEACDARHRTVPALLSKRGTARTMICQSHAGEKMP